MLFILKCNRKIDELGIKNAGGWNVVAFWDHLDSCDECREASVVLNEALKGLMIGEKEFLAAISGQG